MEDKDTEKKNLETDAQNTNEGSKSLIKQILDGSKTLKKKIIIKGLAAALAVSLIGSMIAGCDNKSQDPLINKEGNDDVCSTGDNTEVKMSSEEGKNIENSSEYKEMLQAYKDVENGYLEQGYVEVPTRGTDRHPMATNYYKDKWNLSDDDIKNNTNIVNEFYSDDSVYILTLVTRDTIKYPDGDMMSSYNPYKTENLYSLLRYNNVDSTEINDLINLWKVSRTGKQMAENAVKHDMLLNKVLAKYDYDVLTENFGNTSSLDSSAIGKNFQTSADITISGYEDGKAIVYAVFDTKTSGTTLYKCTRDLDMLEKYNLESYDLTHYKIPNFNTSISMAPYQDVQEIDNVKCATSIDASMHFDDGVIFIFTPNP